jgi:hypothetical protein
MSLILDSLGFGLEPNALSVGSCFLVSRDRDTKIWVRYFTEIWVRYTEMR